MPSNVRLVVDVEVNDDVEVVVKAVFANSAEVVVLVISPFTVDVNTVDDGVAVSSKFVVVAVVSEILDESSVELGAIVDNAGATVVSTVSFMSRL